MTLRDIPLSSAYIIIIFPRFPEQSPTLPIQSRVCPYLVITIHPQNREYGQDTKEARDASAQPYAGPRLASTARPHFCLRIDLDSEEGRRPPRHRKGLIFPR
jgi:hypothetical protein